ncbi:MAG: hypothetical protein EA402_08500 [Planctomycetota bacterium]|nr:MAG: hypothetical protein EA402_08500 [Planctomycetota bacterium]
MHMGIDEAGYGPLLGPLTVVAISSDYSALELTELWQANGLTVIDSKRLHSTGRLGPLEAVALGLITWATGFTPAHAGELFSLFGESEEERAHTPWTSQAKNCSLPLEREPLTFPGGGGGQGLSGGLLHPWHLNQAQSQGINRSMAQWQVIANCLIKASTPSLQMSCDRLGGRCYYQTLLQQLHPDWNLRVLEESRRVAAYEMHGQGNQHRYEFLVGGEAANILIAGASCIAKYCREVHMRLLNQWWQQQLRWLRPTAGYPQDAKRWLHQIGSGHRSAWGFHLERGWKDDGH